MTVTEAVGEKTLDSLLERIRPAVRAREPYVVGAPPEAPVKLNQNESPFDVPPELKQELLEAFKEISFNRYPTEQPNRLRHALADFTGHDPEGILIGNGSNELAYTLGLCLIDPDTPVVLPRPMFSFYEKVVRLHEGELVAVPPRSDMSFDAAALVEAVRSAEPGLTVLATPNNPTGQAMPLAEIERIADEASGFVVIDEAYVEFSEEQSALTILGRHPNLIVMRTFSKAYGLAGLRLGYLLAHPDVIGEFMKARLPFMVNRFAEQTAITLLKHTAMLEERIARIKAACQELKAALRTWPQVEVLPSQANFVLFKTPLEPGALMDRLAEAGVLVRSMSGYPELKDYLRVNAGTSDENKAFLDALETTLSQP